MEATAEMPIDEMIDLIQNAPPGPWPSGWAAWDNTNAAMRRLSDEFAANLTPNRNVYEVPRGIVIAGGGLKYFPSVWVNVNLLRHHGCELPIQLWYLGDDECDPYMKRLLAPLTVMTTSGAIRAARPNAVRGVQRRALDGLETYFNHHRNHLDYAGRLAEGRPIGSGLIEGACKNYVGRRLKQTGARWRPENANHLADLAGLFYSDDWDHYWN